MVKPPYVAYVNPTGIIIIAFAKKNIQRSIVTIHIMVGPMLVKPLVVFKNPLDVIPSATANNKKGNNTKIRSKLDILIGRLASRNATG